MTSAAFAFNLSARSPGFLVCKKCPLRTPVAATTRSFATRAPVLEAGCFAHARRKLFELANIVSSARKKNRCQRSNMIYPFALEAAQRFDTLFDIERGINGKSPSERLATSVARPGKRLLT